METQNPDETGKLTYVSPTFCTGCGFAVSQPQPASYHLPLSGPPMHRTPFLLLIVVLLAPLAAVTPTSSQAQEPTWTAHISVYVPISDDSSQDDPNLMWDNDYYLRKMALASFRDSLMDRSGDQDLLRRRLEAPPQSRETIYEDLQQNICSMGLEPGDANAARITYRLFSDGQRYWDQIERIRFLYTQDQEGCPAEIPMFALQDEDPLLQETMTRSGIRGLCCAHNIDYFSDLLDWHKLEGVRLTSLNGRHFPEPDSMGGPMHPEAQQAQQRLLETIAPWIY